MGNATIKYMVPLGGFDEKYGQRYWGQLHGTDMDAAFNLMYPVNFEDGDEIEYEEKVIKETGPQSKNPGVEYVFLKKVKKTSGSDGPAPVSQSTTAEPSTIKDSTEAQPESAAPEYEAGTNARWAIKLSFDSYIRTIGYPPEEDDTNLMWEAIEGNAKKLVDIFHRIKNGKTDD